MYDFRQLSKILRRNLSRCMGAIFSFYFNRSGTRLRCRVGGLPPPKPTLEFIVPLGAALDGKNFTRKT